MDFWQFPSWTACSPPTPLTPPWHFFASLPPPSHPPSSSPGPMPFLYDQTLLCANISEIYEALRSTRWLFPGSFIHFQINTFSKRTFIFFFPSSMCMCHCNFWPAGSWILPSIKSQESKNTVLQTSHRLSMWWSCFY